jgi:hypothetical protein
MVLMLWINGYRHDFSTDEGFDLVVEWPLATSTCSTAPS